MPFEVQRKLGPIPLGKARRYSGEVVVGKDKDGLEILREDGLEIVPIKRDSEGEFEGPKENRTRREVFSRTFRLFTHIKWVPDVAYVGQAQASQ